MNNVEKKDYLGLYTSSQRIINRCRLYLDEIRIVNNSILNYEVTDQELEKEYFNLITTFTEELNSRICKYETVQKSILSNIDKMPDDVEKECLKLRYIVGLKWDEIAGRMLFSVQHIHRIHNKAIDDLRISYVE